MFYTNRRSPSNGIGGRNLAARARSSVRPPWSDPWTAVPFSSLRDALERALDAFVGLAAIARAARAV
jgi:hypothetical protein